MKALLTTLTLIILVTLIGKFAIQVSAELEAKELKLKAQATELCNASPNMQNKWVKLKGELSTRQCNDYIVK